MRNLKVLGLAVVAVLAMSAVAASSASAATATFTGSATPLGHDVTAAEGGFNELTGAAGIRCGEATYDGTVTAVSSLTVTPTYSKCSTSGGAPMTITHNGCTYTLTLGTKSGTTAPVTTTVDCPVGQKIEIHFYEDAAHTKVACTLEIGAQGPLTGLTAHHIATPAEHVRITGTVPGIANSLSGKCAGGGTVPGPNAELHADYTFTGIGIH